MENEHEAELAQLLQSYQVDEADEALLDRIVAAAAESKVIVFTQPKRFFVARQAAIAATLAALGFFCGFALPQAGEVTQASSTINSTPVLDNVILGPKSYSEVIL